MEEVIALTSKEKTKQHDLIKQLHQLNKSKINESQEDNVTANKHRRKKILD